MLKVHCFVDGKMNRESRKMDREVGSNWTVSVGVINGTLYRSVTETHQLQPRVASCIIQLA